MLKSGPHGTLILSLAWFLEAFWVVKCGSVLKKWVHDGSGVEDY